MDDAGLQLRGELLDDEGQGDEGWGRGWMMKGLKNDKGGNETKESDQWMVREDYFDVG